MIPYAKHSISPGDLYAVQEAMLSDSLTQGRSVEQFEDAVCEYTGARYCVACSSGTAALWLAYRALLPTCAQTTVPSISFVATANMVEAVGGDVLFSDVDKWGRMSETYGDVLVPMHMAGQSVDMASLQAPVIIEDACHAFGGSYNGYKVGSCRESDACCFSFHASKTITTLGEGGCVTTNSAETYEKLVTLRNHGFAPGTHMQKELGYNFRLTCAQAACGLSQLRRVDEFVERRKEIASFYTEALDGLVDMPMFNEESAHHLFVIRTPRRDELKAKLYEAGIMTQVHYQPIHLQPYWADCGDKLEGAESYAREALSLPLFPTFTKAEQAYVVNSVAEALA